LKPSRDDVHDVRHVVRPVVRLFDEERVRSAWVLSVVDEDHLVELGSSSDAERSEGEMGTDVRQKDVCVHRPGLTLRP
jgi:hypothetical protein